MPEMSEDQEFEDILANWVINPELLPEQRSRLMLVLGKYRDIFPTAAKPYGSVPNVAHRIDTGEARPFRQTPRRFDWTSRKLVTEEVERMLHKGIIHRPNPRGLAE